MIRTATTELRIGQLKPTYLDITFDLKIDADGVEPISAEISTEGGPGPTKVNLSVDPYIWWDLLDASEQDEIVREIMGEEKNPADEWDFNDNGNPKMFKKWRAA